MQICKSRPMRTTVKYLTFHTVSGWVLVSLGVEMAAIDVAGLDMDFACTLYAIPLAVRFCESALAKRAARPL